MKRFLACVLPFDWCLSPLTAAGLIVFTIPLLARTLEQGTFGIRRARRRPGFTGCGPLG